MSEKQFIVLIGSKDTCILYDEKTYCFYEIYDSARNVNILCERLNGLVEENEQLMKKLDYFQKRTIDLGEQLDYAKDDSEEVSRLCRIIGEDKTTIAKLEEQRERLEEVIDKQNDLIETLWELYTDEQKPKH